VDDPHNIHEAESEAIRQGVLEWWDQVMSTRLNDPKTGAKVVVMQRVHQQDAAGHLLEQGGYEHLCLPAAYEGDKGATSIGWTDPCQEAGHLPWPERFGHAEIEELNRSMGSYAAAGQLQRRPSPAEGGILKRHWWRYWKPKGSQYGPVLVRLPNGVMAQIDPVELDLAELQQQVQSWDCAFKDTKDSDYVAGGVWGRKGADKFALDLVRDRLDCPKTISAVRSTSAKWPNAHAKLVEDKANGPAVIQMLRHEVSGLIPVNPEGGKEARAHASSPQVEAGNVYLPHPDYEPWVDGFIEECAAFPNGAHDDQVDQCTQALIWMAKRGSGIGGSVWTMSRPNPWKI
jgi:predicted phage terminase large subunit-like protein